MKKLSRPNLNSWYFKVGLFALFLRLFFMPITFHPDFISLNSSRFFLVEEKTWNFYDFLASLPKGHPLSQNYGQNYYTYPPLSYYTFGFFSLLLKPFSGQDITFWLIENYPRIFSHPGLGKQLFFFKFPYLFFDAGIAFLLWRLFDKEKEKKKVLLLWFFNPVSLYSAYMVGQFELLPLFFGILALFLVKKNRPNLAAFSLGVGGAYKLFPLFFLPILATTLGKSSAQKFKLFLLGLLPFLISIAPFLNSAAFRQAVLFSQQSQKFLHLILPVSGAEGIYPFVFLWGLVFFASWYYQRSQLLSFWFLAIMLVFFSLTHYHPQWFIWLTPFLIIELVRNQFRPKFLVAVLLLSWFLITLFFESSLNYGLFVPLNPRLWGADSLAKFVAHFYGVFQLKSLIRSLFAAAALMILIYWWKNETKKSY